MLLRSNPILSSLFLLLLVVSPILQVSALPRPQDPGQDLAGDEGAQGNNGGGAPPDPGTTGGGDGTGESGDEGDAPDVDNEENDTGAEGPGGGEGEGLPPPLMKTAPNNGGRDMGGMDNGNAGGGGGGGGGMAPNQDRVIKKFDNLVQQQNMDSTTSPAGNAMNILAQMEGQERQLLEQMPDQNAQAVQRDMDMVKAKIRERYLAYKRVLDAHDAYVKKLTDRWAKKRMELLERRLQEMRKYGARLVRDRKMLEQLKLGGAGNAMVQPDSGLPDPFAGGGGGGGNMQGGGGGNWQGGGGGNWQGGGGGG